MTRLIIEAVSNSKHESADNHLKLLVSVTWSDTGKPVSELTNENFRITNIGIDKGEIPTVFEGKESFGHFVFERKWHQPTPENSGVYDLVVEWFDLNKMGTAFFKKGQTFSFGIQVNKPVRGRRNKMAFGQTIVTLTHNGGSKL